MLQWVIALSNEIKIFNEPEQTINILNSAPCIEQGIPTFDLTEMGLPVHTIGDSFPSMLWGVSDKLSEISEALDKGAVQFKLMTDAGETTVIGTQTKADPDWAISAAISLNAESGHIIIRSFTAMGMIMVSSAFIGDEVELHANMMGFITRNDLADYLTEEDVIKLIEGALWEVENGTY